VYGILNSKARNRINGAAAANIVGIVEVMESIDALAADAGDHKQDLIEQCAGASRWEGDKTKSSSTTREHSKQGLCSFQ
jgi:hypothetical protein